MYLEAFIQMSENGLPAITQAEFLLCDAYCHLVKPEQAEEHFDKSTDGIIQISRNYSCDARDDFLFQTMRDASVERLERANITFRTEQQIAAMQAKEAAVRENKDEEDEELRKAMELSLGATTEGGEEEEGAQTSAAPSDPEEGAKLAKIRSQEEEGISILDNVIELLSCYKMLPEIYLEHIVHLRKLIDYSLQKGGGSYDIGRKMINTLMDLAELYLSQHAVDPRPCIMQMMRYFYAQAEEAHGKMVLEVLQIGEVEFFIPICMTERIVAFGKKLRRLESGSSPVTDAELLQQLEKVLPAVLETTFDQKITSLTEMVYLSGKLCEYALQVRYLKALLDAQCYVNEEKGLAYKIQSTFLLSHAYFCLKNAEQGRAYFNQGDSLLREISSRNGAHDFAFMQEMMELCSSRERVLEVEDSEEDSAGEGEELVSALALFQAPEAKDASASLAPPPAPPIALGALQSRFTWFGLPVVSAGKRKAEAEAEAALIKESREMALKRREVGPETIPGWELENVPDDGNCFYTAVALELEKSEGGSVFLAAAPAGSSYSNYLRQHIQKNAFREGEWGGAPEILRLISDPQLRIAVAVIDTRWPKLGFVYYYADPKTGFPDNTQDSRKIPEGTIRVRLAYTGIHYLSVKQAPEDLLQHTPQSRCP